MKTCVIFNPTARGNRARNFRGFLDSVAGECALKPTWAAGAARTIAAQAVAEGFDTIVAAGGDGTLNEVLNGIGDAPDGFARARLGLLPLGTVNVFAKELGLPPPLPAAWEVVRAGRERLVDLPCAELGPEPDPERRYFAQLAGAGPDAEAIALVDWNSKRRLGQLAYVVAGLRVLLRQRHPRITVRFDGREFAGEFVMLGNGRFYGGRLAVFPDARLDDGKLDVCVVPKVSFVTLTRFGLALVLRRKRLPGVLHFQSGEFELRAGGPVRFEVEGDAAGWLPARIRVLPRALRVVIP